MDEQPAVYLDSLRMIGEVKDEVAAAARAKANRSGAKGAR